MNRGIAIPVIVVLILFGAYVTGTGYQPIPDEQYDILLKILRNELNVPVKERTKVQKSAIVKLWRSGYTLSDDRCTILLDGQTVVRESHISKLVKKEISKTKGSGTRKLHKRLGNKVIGLSEKRVQSENEKSEIYSLLNAKFSNKDILRPIYAKRIHDIHQIDLIDLANLHARVDDKYYRYALSVIDVFSRFLWLVPLERKISKMISRALRSIYLVHGTPKILQSDNGKEFEGAVSKLMRSMDVKIIRSSPYHPKSQGKVERSHRSLRKKIMYDLLKKRKRGMNWVIELPIYNKVLNEEPKEELGWKSPFEVYFGRPSNCVLIPGDSAGEQIILPSEQLKTPKPRHYRDYSASRKSTRKAARKATKRINQRTVERCKRAKPPTVYSVNDKVLVKLTKNKKSRLSSARIVTAFIAKDNIRLARYKVTFKSDGGKFITKWVPVSDITSHTISEERRKDKIQQQRKNKSIYHIELTHDDRLSNITSQGFNIALDPEGDGRCQFAAMADQLTSIGVYRSPDGLRQEVVGDIRSRPLTSDGTDLSMFVHNNDLQGYLSGMDVQNTYGDHLTLLRISEMFYCRVLVVSSLGPDHNQVVGSNGPLLILGHLPEGHGEHYVSLQPQSSSHMNVCLRDLDISTTSQDEIISTRDERPDISSSTTSIFDLPVEILMEIVKCILDNDLAVNTTLREVHPTLGTLCDDYMRLYPNSVRRYNRRVYLAPHIMETVRPNDDGSLVISVQRLSRRAGRHSGLMMAVKEHLEEYRKWWLAWLVLMPISNGWFRIDNVYWHR